MVTMDTISDYNETFDIPIENILLYDEVKNNLYSPKFGILKTLKNPFKQYENLHTDNTIYIAGENLYNKNTFVQSTITIEQELNEPNWVLLEPKIKLFPYQNNEVSELSELNINNFNFLFKDLKDNNEIKIENNQIILPPIITNTNKLEIKINFPIAYIIIDCWLT
jgi:hypothetical protein